MHNYVGGCQSEGHSVYFDIAIAYRALLGICGEYDIAEFAIAFHSRDGFKSVKKLIEPYRIQDMAMKARREILREKFEFYAIDQFRILPERVKHVIGKSSVPRSGGISHGQRAVRPEGQRRASAPACRRASHHLTGHYSICASLPERP